MASAHDVVFGTNLDEERRREESHLREHAVYRFRSAMGEILGPENLFNIGVPNRVLRPFFEETSEAILRAALRASGGGASWPFVAKASVIGAAIATGSTLGYSFSGQDSNFNIIEGLRHGGWAGELRKRNTDFGSGWKGLFGGISRRISKYLASGVKEGAELLLSPVRAAEAARRTGTLEEFIEAIGYKGKKYIARTPEEAEKISGWLSDYAKKTNTAVDPRTMAAVTVPDVGIFINVPALREQGTQWGMKYAGMEMNTAQKLAHSEDFLKTLFYHETLEAGTLARFGQFKQMPTKHIGSQVLIGEGGFLGRLENKELESLFAGIRGRMERKEEAKAFSLGKYLFSGNSFDGMPHGGLGAKLRKILTDFGSKYDLVKAMAKMLGETFESLTQKQAFRLALEQGSIVRELGSGAFGTTHLMETTYRGQKLQYARKHIDLPSVGSMLRTNPKEIEDSVIKEFGFLKQLHETATVPSPYHKTSTDIFMELMPGKELSEIIKAGGKLPAKAIRDVQDTAKMASRKYIVNRDIHSGNILYDEATGRTAWVDWGVAEVRIQEQPLLMFQEMNEIISKKLIPHVGIPARYSLDKSAKDLEADKIQVWENGRSGGKGHERRTPLIKKRRG